MKRAKLHRSHLQQTLKIKSELIRSQKQHIFEIVDEYVGEIIRGVDTGVDWDCSDQNQINAQYQEVIGTLTKASTLLDELANSVLDILSEDENDGSSHSKDDAGKGEDEKEREIKKEELDVTKTSNDKDIAEQTGKKECHLGNTQEPVLSKCLQSSDVAAEFHKALAKITKQKSPSPVNYLSSSTPSKNTSSPSSVSFRNPSPLQHPASPRLMQPSTASLSSSSPSPSFQSFNNPQQSKVMHVMNLTPPAPFVIQNSTPSHIPGMVATSVAGNYHGQSLAYAPQSSIQSIVHLQQTANQQLPTHSLPPSLTPPATMIAIPPPPPPPPQFIRAPLPSVIQHHNTITIPPLSPQLQFQPRPQQLTIPHLPPSILSQSGPLTSIPPSVPLGISSRIPYVNPSAPQLQDVTLPPTSTKSRDLYHSSLSSYFSPAHHIEMVSSSQQPTEVHASSPSPDFTTIALNPNSAPFLPGSEISKQITTDNRAKVESNQYPELDEDLHNESLSSLSNTPSALDPESTPFSSECIISKSPKQQATKDPVLMSGTDECNSSDVSTVQAKIEASAILATSPTKTSTIVPQSSIETLPTVAKSSSESSTIVPKSSIYSDKNNSASWEDFSRLIEKFSESESESEVKSSVQSSQSNRTKESGVKASPDKPQQTRIVKGSILAGKVFEPDSPWSFHVQLGGEIDQIAQDIRDYIKGNDGSNDISSLLVTPGMFCLALFPEDGEYYRAKVIEMEGENVTVLYVDYGNTSKVSLSNLRPLPTSLATRPIMAIWCALSGAAPTNSENMWTEEAILYFQQKLFNQTIQIRVVQLASEKSEGGASIPHLVNVVFKMSSKSSENPQIQSNVTTKPVDMSRMLIKEKMGKAVGLKDQVATLIKLNQPVDKKKMPSQDLSRLDDLINLMKSSNLSSPGHKGNEKCGSVISGLRKPEPLCFTNVKKTSGPKVVESFKNMLKSSNGELMKNDKTIFSKSKDEAELETEEKELIPTSEQKDDYSLGCLVNKRLHELRGELEKEDVAGKRDNNSIDRVSSMMQNILLGKSDTNTREIMDGVLLATANGDEIDAVSCDSNVDTELEFSVMVSEILTPNSFFVHLVTEEACTALMGIERQLTAVMREKKSLANPVKTSSKEKHADEIFTPKKFRLCCTQFVKAYNLYCRAMVLDIFSDDVLVFAVDYGHYEWQHKFQLKPLPAQFTDLSPLVLWCSLSYTQPLRPGVRGHNYDRVQTAGKGEVDHHEDWTWSAVEQFKRIVGKDKLLNVVVTKSAIDKCIESSRSFSLQLEALPIYLLDRSNPGDEICLNHELIHRELAIVGKSTLDMAYEDDDSDGYLEEEDDVDDWNPMVEDFESLRNSYKVDIDDPGVALVGYKARDVGQEGRRVCLFYNRPEGCYRGDRCSFLHTKVQDGELSFDKVPVFQFDPDQSSILPPVGSCIGITVSAVFSPMLFYVTLPWSGLTLDRLNSDPTAVKSLAQTETLESLMDSMQLFYRGSHYDGDMTAKAQGQALALKVGNNWLRAKVVDVDPDNERVQVMCIDFGDIYWVHEKNTRDIEMRFLHLPPQAIECCLEEVTWDGSEAMTSWLWGSDAVKLLADLVRDKTLVGHINQRLPSGRVQLSLIDTSVSGQELNVGKELIRIFHENAGLSPPSDKKISKTVKLTSQQNPDSVCMDQNYLPG